MAKADAKKALMGWINARAETRAAAVDVLPRRAAAEIGLIRPITIAPSIMTVALVSMTGRIFC